MTQADTQAESRQSRPAKEAPDMGGRVRLGAAVDTPADILAELAQDASVTVRAAVAMNASAPALADALLASDVDERVRTLLARKLAMLIPSVPQPQRSVLEGRVFQMLSGLVEDEAVRVRAAIAEAVKEMPHAPRDLILRLARDSALPVSEPVVRLSPLLAADDLLALLAEAPSGPTAQMVARRARLPESVADAIAASADTQAIAALLRNHSAAIREATLDALIERAAEHREWHDPLVRRPALSPRAMRALSEIVTTQLLSVLASRGDLEAGVTEELQNRLALRRAAHAPAGVTWGARSPAAAPEPSPGEALAQARALHGADRLDEAALAAAAQRGELSSCVALLAVAAELPVAVVERTVALRSAKGLVTMVWKAGFSMRIAAMLQALLCRLGPDAVLNAADGGGFPLSAEEMRWQLEFLQRSGH